MSENTTKPTTADITAFLDDVSDTRRAEAETLIAMMQRITGEQPTLWGTSIIGFGTQHYKYETGREGDMPRLSFSPRKASMTIYFMEGFDEYSEELARLGKHKISVGCLYVTKLAIIDLSVLQSMLEKSFRRSDTVRRKVTSVEEYLERVSAVARPKLNELRALVRAAIPEAREVVSYDIIGYKTDDSRAKVYVSGWNDHVALYPAPKSKALVDKVRPYMRGKGTVWFGLNDDLPSELITMIAKELTQ